ncbi:UNVERIFIED_CONTAM: hypothetical protein Scaly_1919100 [Sesamum calycinum]|uniref:Retrotransposon gag domain-containing protein n=1 Tax=Sesamum calycinum TaxID=2727403 RepID=A0AAW2NIH6_9LAMI
MATNNRRTIKELNAPNSDQQPLCITYSDTNDGFELKSGLIHLLPSFHGLAGEDPHKHLKEFHVVCAGMRPHGITDEQLNLRAFPFSLKDKAKDWLYYLPSGSIETWADMKQQFLQRFFPASRATHLRKEIYGIRQLNGESLYEYWERFKELVASYPHHQFTESLLIQYFYEGLSGMDSVWQYGYHTDKGARRAKARNDSLWDMLKIGHPTDACPSLQEGVMPNVNAVGGFFGNLNGDMIPTLISTIRDGETTQTSVIEIKASNQNHTSSPSIELSQHLHKPYLSHQIQQVGGSSIWKATLSNRNKSEGECECNNTSGGKELQPTGPTPRKAGIEKNALDDTDATHDEGDLDTFKKVEINIPLLDAIKQIPKYAKFLKELCTNKRKLKDKERIIFGKNVSAVINRKLPEKCKDPGASINVMPYSVYQALNLSTLQDTNVIIQLADRSYVRPMGLVEDVLVKVNDLLFPVDFYILKMGVEGVKQSCINLLGRPFMKTAKTKIDVDEGTQVRTQASTGAFEVHLLGKRRNITAIISSKLSKEHEEKLVTLLREHRTAIGWTLADIKGISPAMCMHRIYLEDNTKPSREPQRRLNPTLKEVVMKEILKLLDAGYYQIAIAQEDQERQLLHAHSALSHSGACLLGYVTPQGNTLVPRTCRFYRRFIKDFAKLLNRCLDSCKRMQILCLVEIVKKHLMSETSPD